MTNYPKGSQGAAEAKTAKVILIAGAVITLVVMLCVFVFDTDLRAFSRRAGLFPNIIGAACFVGSWVWLYIANKNEWESKAAIGWLLLLIGGFLFSCGFNFNYFGI